MKVRNMTSANGNFVPNQFIIDGFNKDGHPTSEFQSYRSTIARVTRDLGKVSVELDEFYWDYSATTGKYRNQFLCEKIAETRKKIESGEYKLVDLN